MQDRGHGLYTVQGNVLLGRSVVVLVEIEAVFDTITSNRNGFIQC